MNKHDQSTTMSSPRISERLLVLNYTLLTQLQKSAGCNNHSLTVGRSFWFNDYSVCRVDMCHLLVWRFNYKKLAGIKVTFGTYITFFCNYTFLFLNVFCVVDLFLQTLFYICNAHSAYFVSFWHELNSVNLNSILLHLSQE